MTNKFLKNQLSSSEQNHTFLPRSLPAEAGFAFSRANNLPHAHGSPVSKRYKQSVWEQPGFSEVALVQDYLHKAVEDSQ